MLFPAVLLCRWNHDSEFITFNGSTLKYFKMSCRWKHWVGGSWRRSRHKSDWFFTFSLATLGSLQRHRVNIQLSAEAFPCVSPAVNTTALSNYQKWRRLVCVGNDFFLTHLCQTNEATSKTTSVTCRHCDTGNNASRCNRQDIMAALWQSGASQ